MKLEEIGFYTLSDDRARNGSATSPMERCELILTTRCTFRCPYCRGLPPRYRGDLPLADAYEVLGLWCDDRLRHVRFSGGEPTLYPALDELARYCRTRGVRRIALSTNGSATRERYEQLLAAGVSDVSVSLDACCSSFADRMAGVDSEFDRLVENVRWLASGTYVTVGVVLTEENAGQAGEIIRFADGLGVADIRVIPAAQAGRSLAAVDVSDAILGRHPILRYRIGRARAGLSIRGLGPDDPHRCRLVLDDSVVARGWHFPCVIYMREQGEPIGRVGPGMRAERMAWMASHDIHADPICSGNCLDFCVEHLRRCEEFAK